MLKVMRTDGESEEIIAKSEDKDIIELKFVTTKEPDQYGEFVRFSDRETRNEWFNCKVRKNKSSFAYIEAFRVAIIKIFKLRLEQGRPIASIIIKKENFIMYDEEVRFILILKELLMTYFGEAITNDVLLIISDCEKEPKMLTTIFGVIGNA